MDWAPTVATGLVLAVLESPVLAALAAALTGRPLAAPIEALVRPY